MKLSSTSRRLAGARRFGLELRKAMNVQGRTIRGFSKETSVGRTRLQNWLSGQSLPSVERTEMLADALAWPRLVDLVKAAREVPCDNCGKTFVVDFASPAKYCSAACKVHQAKRVDVRRDLSRAVLQRRVALLDRAVASMCAECEPSGLCRTPTCPLQLAGVSPNRVAVAS